MDPAEGVVMFESDQHEFDEGLDELGHVAPPPPMAKPAAQPVPPVTVEAGDGSVASAMRSELAARTSMPAAPAAEELKPVRSAAPVAVAEPIVEEQEEEEDE